MPYSTLPHDPTIPIESFKISTPQHELDHLIQLLKLTRIPKQTYENTQTTENFGITRQWLIEARDRWLNLDWRAHEERINGIPAYVASVSNKDGREYKIHFMALFSRRPDARPVIFSHGWPGCFLEFLPILEMVKRQWSEQDLPYHLIVPSLPGFAYSSPPPLDKEFTESDVAYLFNELMLGLGFKKYIAQGGDIGSMVSTDMALNYEACTALHINFRPIFSPPKGTPEAEAQAKATKGGSSSQTQDFLGAFQGFGYALEQGTRPSTIGLVVGSNPISLLAWIGEKYMEGSRRRLALETVLSITTLYWLTDTYPSSIYYYRYGFGVRRGGKSASQVWGPKPLGYSLFKHEFAPTPVHWVEKTGNVVWSNEHEEGGHFAALERPEALWNDVEEFIQKAWDLPPRRHLSSSHRSKM